MRRWRLDVEQDVTYLGLKVLHFFVRDEDGNTILYVGQDGCGCRSTAQALVDAHNAEVGR